MKIAALKTIRLSAMALAVASVVGSAACGRGFTLTGSLLTVPTVDGLPQNTNQVNLPIHGLRPPNTQVVAVFNTQRQVVLTSVGADPNWTGMLTLDEGANGFVVVAQTATSVSSPSELYVTTLTRNPPVAPVVDGAFNGNVFIYTGGAASTSNGFLTGTKDPSGDLTVTVSGGNANQIITVDQNLAVWQYPLPTIVVGTAVSYTISSTNLAGNTASITVNAWATQVPPMTINPNNLSTNQFAYTFKGTKTFGDTAYVKDPNMATFTVASDIADNTSAWTHTSTSWRSLANGTLLEVVYQTDSSHLGQQSPYAIARIHYDTQPPVAPTVLQPSPFNNIVLASNSDSGSPTVTIAGTLPSDGGLCIGTNPNSCNLSGVVPPTTFGGSFTVTVPASDGSNTFYVQAVDAAGNFSVPVLGRTIGNIYIISPPNVTLVSTDGNNVTGSGIPLSVGASPVPADGSNTNSAVVSGSQVNSVQVCVEMECTYACGGSSSTPCTNGGGNYNVIIPTGTLSNGPQTITVTTTDAAGGVYTYPPPGSGSFTISYNNGAPVWVNAGDGNQSLLGALHPATAMDASGNLYVVWEDNCSQNYNPNSRLGCSVIPPGVQITPPDIFMRKRDATGTWEATMLVSTTGRGDGASELPTIAIDSTGLVHVAWQDTGSAFASNPTFVNSPAIVHRVYNPTSHVLSAADFFANPRGELDQLASLTGSPYSGGATAHIAWGRSHSAGAGGLVSQGNVLYAQWSGPGSGTVNPNTVYGSWTTPIVVSNNPNTFLAENPTVFESPAGGAYVAWDECRIGGGAITNTDCQNVFSYDVYLASVTNPNVAPANANQIWVTDVSTAGDGGAGNAKQPAMIVDSSNQAYVFWSGMSTMGGAPAGTDHANIFMRQYTNLVPTSAYIYQDVSTNSGGATSGANACTTPRAALNISDGSFTVVWNMQVSHTDTPFYGVQGRSSIVDTTPFLVSTATYPGIGTQAAVALDASNSLYIVWDEDVAISPTNNPNYNNAGTLQPTYGIFFNYLAQQD